MATEVVFPMLGITVERGRILKWIKSEGDQVEKGESILEVEAEKVTTEVESPATGVLKKILVPDNLEIPVLTVVGIITGEEEDVPEKYLKQAPGGVEQPEGEQSRAGDVSAAHGVTEEAVSEELTSEPVAPGAPGRIRAVPAARFKARELGIDLSRVSGSGPGGIILKRDLEQAPTETLRVKIVPMTQMRKVIAKRISNSASAAPHIHLFMDVEMDRLVQHRKKILPDFEKKNGLRVSINDFLIEAAALTLRDFPMLNASVEGDNLKLYPDINVGLAVAVEEGLIVPAIPNADSLGLAGIARMRIELVDKARSGSLSMEEIERGTFTISSLAQLDIAFFTAVLNPPQSGILTVGKLDEKLTLVDGEVKAKLVTRFGLSVDHRIVDGAVAASFLQEFKRKLENPS
jgi:pyruvate dehydrogenase E2 component (dihydrolipoamide acetyltransferase)